MKFSEFPLGSWAQRGLGVLFRQAIPGPGQVLCTSEILEAPPPTFP